MFISNIAGYLSKYKGLEVDAAVERVQGLDSELALKVDKNTEINGIPIEEGITLTAGDIGALSDSTTYGKSMQWSNETLVLYDQNKVALTTLSIETHDANWGRISGNMNLQLDLKQALDSKQDMITSSNMLLSDLVSDDNQTHKFATQAQLTQIATNAGNITTNTESISVINGKIPAQASTENQLADKNFVNSSISTNTANFIGTFSSLADLEAYSGPLTNNDYAFVTSTDTAGNVVYNRYKYNGTTQEWVFEYALNNSSFTSNQWAAINSGATTTNIEQITTNTNAISAINTTIGSYGDIVTHNVSEFATAAQGAKADTALQGIDSSMVVVALGYTPYDSANPSNFISGINSSDVTTALGFTPYNSTNPDGFISGINSSDVVVALGYTPYDSANPSNFISGINSSDVTTALGFTPYDDSNPDGFISSAAISTLTDVNLTSLADGEILKYDSTSGKWINSTSGGGGGTWGSITGTLSDQTDLQNALNDKQDVITGGASSVVTNDLTANRALISDSNGKIAASSITTTKLNYLSDVTSNIQVQLNDKVSSAALDEKASVTIRDWSLNS